MARYQDSTVEIDHPAFREIDLDIDGYREDAATIRLSDLAADVHVDHIAPDVQYYLDCSAECRHLSLDAYVYYRYFAKNVNATFDEIERRVPSLLGEPVVRSIANATSSHWEALRQGGAALEHGYVKWRSENRDEARFVSYVSMPHLHGHLEDFVRDISRLLTDEGFERLSPVAIRYAQFKMRWREEFFTIKRHLTRAAHDLRGLSAEEITLFNFQKMTILDPSCTRRFPQVTPAMRIAARRENRRRKKVLRRSASFLARIAGDDTTRVFIGGDTIRIDGQHCIYEVKKTGDLRYGHGGCSLSLRSKTTDAFLCNICIYTPQTPVLDHVASLIMHIRSGEEETIFQTGNLYNVSVAAYDQSWLAPYVPKQHGEFTIPEIMNASLRTTRQRVKKRDTEVRRLRILADIQAYLRPHLLQFSDLSAIPPALLIV